MHTYTDDMIADMLGYFTTAFMTPAELFLESNWAIPEQLVGMGYLEKRKGAYRITEAGEAFVKHVKEKEQTGNHRSPFGPGA